MVICRAEAHCGLGICQLTVELTSTCLQTEVKDNPASFSNDF